MNRIPRRPAAVPPAARGRAAASLDAAGGDTPLSSPRLRLPASPGRTSVMYRDVRTPCDELPPCWNTLLAASPGLRLLLHQPSRTLAVLIGLLALAFLLGRVH